MSIIAWIVLGILAGAIAKAIYPGYQGGGILSTMILGIIGAFVGGSLFTLLRTGTLQITAAGTGLTLPGVLVAVLGAIVAIYLWGLIRRSSNA
ncbi:MAG: GlsB/YeaQ/YmgE family stress response membrane protein [Nostoc sp.]|uniref:GlsB/YeaQ/YmgE family stress response membrane protein n=1 Tax=Nostoc sp. TaxID=1180 RepID=UPI002FEEAFCB